MNPDASRPQLRARAGLSALGGADQPLVASRAAASADPAIWAARTGRPAAASPRTGARRRVPADPPRRSARPPRQRRHQRWPGPAATPRPAAGAEPDGVRGADEAAATSRRAPPMSVQNPTSCMTEQERGLLRVDEGQRSERRHPDQRARPPAVTSPAATASAAATKPSGGRSSISGEVHAAGRRSRCERHQRDAGDEAAEPTARTRDRRERGEDPGQQRSRRASPRRRRRRPSRVSVARPGHPTQSQGSARDTSRRAGQPGQRAPAAGAGVTPVSGAGPHAGAHQDRTGAGVAQPARATATISEVDRYARCSGSGRARTQPSRPPSDAGEPTPGSRARTPVIAGAKRRASRPRQPAHGRHDQVDRQADNGPRPAGRPACRASRSCSIAHVDDLHDGAEATIQMPAAPSGR